MKKKTRKMAVKKSKKVEPVLPDGDKCEYCGRLTDTIMQASNGSYACECCLEEAEEQIEYEKECDQNFYSDENIPFWESR
jgi:hypothetical protein